ncbi:MAG TPA: type II secretion system protein, partial [Bdellovibrio sp.]|nr:type II secretion system protein [Bdellovibrio sp.]
MTKPSRRNFLRLSLFSDEFSSGFSLVELLVSIGIMGVMLAAFSAMQANQFREVRALNEQLSAMTAQNSAMAILSDGQVCQFMLASQTFNSTLPPDSTAAGSEVLSTAIPVRPSSPVNVLAVGDPASPLSNTLKVTAIKTRDFTPDPSDANLYKANIRVQFNGPPDTVRPIKDAIIPVVITTTNGGTPSATIQSCKPSFGAGNQNYLSYWASTTVLGSTTMYNDPGTGNIGIGTTTPTMPFDVSGIRIGNSSTCLPGALRYNSALTGSMEFCDNTGAWKAAFS